VTQSYGERLIVDHLVERVGAYNREVLVNYYVALKAKRFVVLAGSSTLDKMSLAQGLAEALVPVPGRQWSLLQAHPWWVSRSGNPGQLALLHARFSSLKLLEALEEAGVSEDAGLPMPFFVGIDCMSPAEAVCYFDDLPNSRMWLPDGRVVRVRVPHNLYVTGSLDVEDRELMVLSPELCGQAITIRLWQDDAAPNARARSRGEPRLDRQAMFVRAAVRTPDQARARLAQVLTDKSAPLGPLDEVVRRLGVQGLSPSVYEEALLYLANAFAEDGHGLFVEAVSENLAIAQDYALAQSVLPHVVTGRLEPSTVRHDELKEYLTPRFPRAHAWIERLPTVRSNVRGARRTRSDSVSVELGPGLAVARHVAH